MQKISSVVAQFHRKYKHYVAVQTIPHVVGYLYSLALRGNVIELKKEIMEEAHSSAYATTSGGLLTTSLSWSCILGGLMLLLLVFWVDTTSN